ncbi:MAG: hypothetical protein IKA31_03700 [Clostridia bacterium]|nr:hypothetical protein [Clostridia bacterium]
MEQLLKTINSFPDRSPSKIFFSLICACKLKGQESIDANKIYDEVFKHQDKLPYIYYSAMVSKSDFVNTLILFNQYGIIDLLEVSENQSYMHISLSNEVINNFFKNLNNDFKTDIFYLADKAIESNNNNYKNLCF